MNGSPYHAKIQPLALFWGNGRSCKKLLTLAGTRRKFNNRIFPTMTDIPIIPSLFEYQLADNAGSGDTVSKSIAGHLMDYFRNQPLFKWACSHNGCEARADAVCLLLDEWDVPNYKAWVFSGRYLKKHVGQLKQNWKYHVAPLLPVIEDGALVYYIIDPATSGELQTMYGWAANVTEYAHSYHMIKEPQWYIFHDKKITRDNWHARNRRNRKWMVQGLANVNGLSARGKAELIFNRKRIKNTATAFEQLKNKRPPFL